MRIVYSLGGSILAGQDAQGLKAYAKALKEISAKNEVYVVVGGGKIARDYIGKARELGADESFCDYLGITATRMNAMLLMAALGLPPEVPDSYSRARALCREEGMAVMGGLYPGQTTDTVAALLAEYVGAERLVIATSVDGVYTADPEKVPDARKIPFMEAADLVQMSMGTRLQAGSRSPVDPIASKIIERSRIPTSVVLGLNVANLEKAISGSHTGTEITATIQKSQK